jgi:hypothetical protein
MPAKNIQEGLMSTNVEKRETPSQRSCEEWDIVERRERGRDESAYVWKNKKIGEECRQKA